MTLSALIPLGWYSSLFLHELAHAVAVWMLGGRVLAFKPYPHFHDGRFWVGRVSSILTIRHTQPDRAHWVSIAPFIKNCFMAPAWTALALAVWAPLWVFAAWEAWAGVWFWTGIWRGAHTDAAKWRASR